MNNKEFAKTEAGKVWNVFKQNGHIEYGSWLVEEMAKLDRAKNNDIEME